MTETRKSFHEELDQLRHDVIVLAAAAEEAIQAGTAALLDGDLAAVEKVIAEDRHIDELTHSAEDRCYELLARQQPMAVDLRILVTVLRIIHELERVGDLMVNVAKTTRRLFPGELEPRVRGIIDRMREQASAQVRLAVDAFADRDPVRAGALADMDDVMDDLQKELFRAVFAGKTDDEHALHRAVQIALVGRYFERIADHAVNVGERVEFMVTGHFRSAERTARGGESRA